MMAFLFGDISDLVDESEGLAEIGKLERFGEVVAIDDAPARDLLGKALQFLSREGRNPAAARNAVFTGQVGHSKMPPATDSKQRRQRIDMRLEEAAILISALR